MSDKPFRIGDNIAVRSQLIVEAKYKLKGKENDIVDMLLTEIEPDNKLEYELNIKKYKNFYGYKDDKIVYRDLKDAVKTIECKRIRCDEINSKKSYAWFPKIEYRDNEGKIILELHKDIKKAMVDYKNKIYYHIKYSLPLQGEYSKRFYYYAKSFTKSNWRMDRIEDLREKLEIGEKYPLYADFKRFVLIPSQKQINNKSDINVEFTELKMDKSDRRKVTHIKTIVKSKEVDELENIKVEYNKNIKKSENLRKEIIELYNKYEKLLTPSVAKKKIAEILDVTVVTVNRYMNITNNLIPPLIELLDDNLLTLTKALKLVKETKEVQFENLESIKISAELKKKEKDTITIKEKQIVVDVTEYEEVKEEKINNEYGIERYINSNDEIFSEIDEVKEILKDLKIDDNIAEKIYDNSEENINYIKYIYEEYKKNSDKIPNPVGWIREMVKPNVYIKPVYKKSNKKGKFHSYDQRTYNFEELEKKLLGWDDEE